MKKTLFMLSALITCAIASQAQSLTVNNNTACDVFAAPIGVDANCTGSYGLINGGLTIPAFSSHTFVSSDYAPQSSSVYPGFVNLSDTPAPPPIIRTHVIVGSACSGQQPRATVPLAGCPSNLATWTDLGGGNAQVDIN